MKVVEGDPRLLKVTTADDLAKIASMAVTAVVFDVGETLVDESGLDVSRRWRAAHADGARRRARSTRRVAPAHSDGRLTAVGARGRSTDAALRPARLGVGAAATCTPCTRIPPRRTSTSSARPSAGASRSRIPAFFDARRRGGGRPAARSSTSATASTTTSLPALAAGMRRGARPARAVGACSHESPPEADHAIDSLAELPEALA